jgi:DNA-binding NarL/FixJ family response regulator
MDAPRVLLAEDHPLVAKVIAECFADAFQLVGIVRNGGALLEAAKTLKPDVIVTDISMPGINGLIAMKQIRKSLPHMRVILLTNYGDASLARYALDAGASGFVLKISASSELVDAVRTVVDGGIYVSSAIAAAMENG